MSHRYDIGISERCVDPNLFMVERQDPDNFTRFQTRERCALEIAAYVFKVSLGHTTASEPVFLLVCRLTLRHSFNTNDGRIED